MTYKSKLIKIKRTHDSLYLKENRYENTKEIFIFLNNILAKIDCDKKIIADFGCVAGEFLFFLKTKPLSNCKLYGFDIHNFLIKKARKKVDNVNFSRLNLNLKKKKYQNFFDISICTGVLSIFDDFYNIIDNLIYYTKKRDERERGGAI